MASVIAEALGTTEKALIVDGNCTGGLVAVELAAREIARGAPWALAGALSYVDTVNQVLYSNARLLSAEGCFPYARKGKGTVISDGVVMLVLTSLERAQQEGLPVHGVLRGVGGGNDGATEGYMLVPNPRGHELAIRRAVEQAGVSPSELGVLLSHGTGTRAGDAVETTVFNRALKMRGGCRAASLASARAVDQGARRPREGSVRSGEPCRAPLHVRGRAHPRSAP